MATYKDIQNRTGLSLATISKYFNGGNVRPDNASAIAAAARELGFRRNQFAQSLRTQRSLTVGVVLPNLSNLFHGTITSYLSGHLRNLGYGTVVATTQDGREDAAEFLLGKMVDGIVAVPEPTGAGTPALEEVPDDFPLVFLDRPPIEGTRYDSVVVANESAGYEVAARFARAGHRHLAILAGPADLVSTQARAKGAVAGATDWQLPAPIVLNSPLSAEAGRAVTRGLMRNAPAQVPTAVFATNSELTTGAAIAFRELAVRIPGELSFIGFDNVELGAAVPPGLEIVEQPTDEIARLAAQYMIERLSGEYSGVGRHAVLDCSFVAGASVGDVRPDNKWGLQAGSENR